MPILFVFIFYYLTGKIFIKSIISNDYGIKGET